MAIVDVFGQVSLSQALTGGGIAGFFGSTNSVDLSPAGVARRFRDVGAGNPLALHMQVTEAFAAGGGGASSLDATIIVANSDGDTLFITDPVTLTRNSNVTAALTLGASFTIPIMTIPDHILDSPTGQPGRRYLGVLYQTLGGDLTYTAGKVTAWFGDWRGANKPRIHGIAYAGP